MRSELELDLDGVGAAILEACAAGGCIEIKLLLVLSLFIWIGPRRKKADARKMETVRLSFCIKLILAIPFPIPEFPEIDPDLRDGNKEIDFLFCLLLLLLLLLWLRPNPNFICILLVLLMPTALLNLISEGVEKASANSREEQTSAAANRNNFVCLDPCIMLDIY